MPASSDGSRSSFSGKPLREEAHLILAATLKRFRRFNLPRAPPQCEPPSLQPGPLASNRVGLRCYRLGVERLTVAGQGSNGHHAMSRVEMDPLERRALL